MLEILELKSRVFLYQIKILVEKTIWCVTANNEANQGKGRIEVKGRNYEKTGKERIKKQQTETNQRFDQHADLYKGRAVSR